MWIDGTGKYLRGVDSQSGVFLLMPTYIPLLQYWINVGRSSRRFPCLVGYLKTLGDKVATVTLED